MKNRILIFLLLLLVAGCKEHHPVELGQKPDSAKKAETAKVKKGSLRSYIKMPGQLKPFFLVDIYPKVNGFVKEVYVDRGSEVHTGQVLMTLEAPEIDQQYEAAISKYLQAQETLNASRDRYMRLKAASQTPGAVAELDLVNAQARFQGDSAFEQSEKANVNAVQALKDYLVVRAPFDGVITQRNIHPGSLTGPNFEQQHAPLLKLQNDKKLRLEIFVPEEYSEKIDMSDKQITFTPNALPGQTFTAAISRASNSLNDEYRSEAIEADVINKNNIFKPGMYVEASLKVKAEVSSFIVPSTSIITSSDRKYVIGVDNGRARLIDVTEGINNNGETEVFGALREDQAILKKPSDEMKDGDIIQ